jgi:hypothetical protein
MVTAISCAIAKCTPKEELPLISAVFSQISSTLATISVQQEAAEKNNIPAVTTPTPPITMAQK